MSSRHFSSSERPRRENVFQEQTISTRGSQGKKTELSLASPQRYAVLRPRILPLFAEDRLSRGKNVSNTRFIGKSCRKVGRKQKKQQSNFPTSGEPVPWDIDPMCFELKWRLDFQAVVGLSPFCPQIPGGIQYSSSPSCDNM